MLIYTREARIFLINDRFNLRGQLQIDFESARFILPRIKNFLLSKRTLIKRIIKRMSRVCRIYQSKILCFIITYIYKLGALYHLANGRLKYALRSISHF